MIDKARRSTSAYILQKSVDFIDINIVSPFSENQYYFIQPFCFERIPDASISRNVLGICEYFHGANPQSCPACPVMVDRGALSMGCQYQIIIQKARSWTIVDKVFGEFHVPSTRKDMFCRLRKRVVYFFFWPLCCLFVVDIRLLITPFA